MTRPITRPDYGAVTLFVDKRVWRDFMSAIHDVKRWLAESDTDGTLRSASEIMMDTMTEWLANYAVDIAEARAWCLAHPEALSNKSKQSIIRPPS